MTDIIYFISEKQLRSACLIDDNVDSAYIMLAIRDAQDIDLQLVIGSSLYKSLKDQIKNNSFTNELYITLLDEYITPYLINDIMATITIPIHYKFRNSGIVMNNDQHYQSARLDEVTYVEQHYKNLATFNANRIAEFLWDNKDEFPELENCSDWIKAKKFNTKNPIFFKK